MPNMMKIDMALINLEAGKFSFQMVDAIKEHVARLENELEVLRAQHTDVLHDLKRQEYANWRLEGEVRKLNARIRVLVKLDRLAEKASRGSATMILTLKAFSINSVQFAKSAFGQAIDDLESGRLESRLVAANSKIRAVLEANLPSQQAARAMASNAGENITILGKRLGNFLEKAAAYLSTLSKTAA